MRKRIYCRICNRKESVLSRILSIIHELFRIRSYYDPKRWERFRWLRWRVGYTHEDADPNFEERYPIKDFDSDVFLYPEVVCPECVEMLYNERIQLLEEWEASDEMQNILKNGYEDVNSNKVFHWMKKG